MGNCISGCLPARPRSGVVLSGQHGASRASSKNTSFIQAIAAVNNAPLFFPVRQRGMFSAAQRKREWERKQKKSGPVYECPVVEYWRLSRQIGHLVHQLPLCQKLNLADDLCALMDEQQKVPSIRGEEGLAEQLIELVDKLAQGGETERLPRTHFSLNTCVRSLPCCEYVSTEELNALNKLTEHEQPRELIGLLHKRLSPNQVEQFFHIAQSLACSEHKAAVLAALALSASVQPINCLRILAAVPALACLDKAMVRACVVYRIDLLQRTDFQAFMNEILALAPEAFAALVDEMVRAEGFRVLHHLAAHEGELTALQKKVLRHKERAINQLVKRVVEKLA